MNLEFAAYTLLAVILTVCYVWDTLSTFLHWPDSQAPLFVKFNSIMLSLIGGAVLIYAAWRNL